MSAGITTGTRIGPYEIVGWLGAGGMGEVYRARDPRLGRDVAIKLIHEAVNANAGRVRRFEQEARAAWQPNHPSITATYHFGTHYGVPYIVSELLEGESLRQRLQKGPLPVRKAIAYAHQAADALAAAHDRGIVHRDVKPDNLFITNDGRLKILDFGIAKLAGSDLYDDVRQAGSETDTVVAAVVGTAAYMSPEQIRGEAIDGRSDIFSLGIVIHEMLAGCPAFARETAADTMAAILNEELPEIDSITVSPTLARTIARCVEKPRESRFQSARDLAFGLDILNGSTGARPAERRRRRLRWQSVVLTLVTATSLAIAGWSWSRYRAAGVQYRSLAAQYRDVPPPFDPLLNASYSPLNGWPGEETSANISPDGRYVTFVADKAGRFDVYTFDIATGIVRNLTAKTKANLVPNDVFRLTGFDEYGAYMWYLDGAGQERRHNKVPPAGGPSQPFLGPDDRSPAWATNSRVVYYTGGASDSLSIAERGVADSKQIREDPPGQHSHNPVWSTDGAWIYFVHSPELLTGFDVWRVRPDGKDAEQLTHLGTDANFLAPLDARTVLFTARAEDMSGPWLWALDVETKTMRRVSTGLTTYTSVAASRDGQRIVVTTERPETALWTVPILDRQATDADLRPYRINASSPLYATSLFAPRVAGSSLYVLNERGASNGLWRLDAWKEPKQVWSGLEGRLNEPAAVSPDGKHIVIVLREDSGRKLMSIAPDGSNRRTLTPAAFIVLGTPGRGAADWSPGGDWIVTGGKDEKGEGLFRIPASGGQAVPLFRGRAQNPVVSPIGDLIVYSSDIVAGKAKVHAVRRDGTPVQLPELETAPGAYRFTPDGKKLIFLPIHDAHDFKMLDLTTGKTTTLTNISATGRIGTFDVTSDGRIVFDRTIPHADIELIERHPTPPR